MTLLDQYHDETHNRAKPGHITKDTRHTFRTFEPFVQKY